MLSVGCRDQDVVIIYTKKQLFNSQFKDKCQFMIYNICMSYERFMYENGIYHVYNRGVNKSNILADPADKDMFLKIVSESQKENNFRLFAYSIMDTHYHMVYQDVGKRMPSIIGTIQESYAKYYNSKYNRIGPVFMNPFKSKIILTTEYMCQSVSYTLNNPVEAFIVKHFSLYIWNSEINEFSKHNLVDTLFLIHIFEQYIDYPISIFIEENSTHGKLCELEIFKLQDLEALDLFNAIVKSITGFEQFNINILPPSSLNEIIRKAHYQGISIRQLVNLTGLSYRYIRKHKGAPDYF